LSRISGVRAMELERHGENGFCWGGRRHDVGRKGRQHERERTEEALRVGPNVIGTACPFCLSMFEDGIRAKDATDTLQVLDLAELVVRAVMPWRSPVTGALDLSLRPRERDAMSHGLRLVQTRPGRPRSRPKVARLRTPVR
jgi:hypothetical protein